MVLRGFVSTSSVVWVFDMLLSAIDTRTDNSIYTAKTLEKLAMRSCANTHKYSKYII